MIVNFNTLINAELNDITATLLLSFFIGWKQTTQFWKQEDIANKLGIERKTIARKLKELKESQYIDFSAVGRNTAKRTKIELLEKAKKFIKSSQPPTTTSLQNDVAKPIASQQKPIAKKNDDVDLYHYDFFIPLMMKQQNERRGEVC